MFELTKHIEAQRRQKLVGAIKAASRIIADCPCPERQYRALRKLRVLQERLGWP